MVPEIAKILNVSPERVFGKMNQKYFYEMNEYLIKTLKILLIFMIKTVI